MIVCVPDLGFGGGFVGLGIKIGGFLKPPFSGCKKNMKIKIDIETDEEVEIIRDQALEIAELEDRLEKLEKKEKG